MNRNMRYALIAVIAGAGILSGCQSAPAAAKRPAGGFSSSLQGLVKDAVFEVVIKKPEEKNLVYDKELDWSLVPYTIRSDKYYSIGTAFAISATEAVTAFHVIDPGAESDVFKEYYIRDSRGGVYELDSIKKASNEKDFVVFTVKEKTFSSWFELENKFTEGAQVYSVGNALGEGIVVRNGLVLGTVPEEEDGRWNLLKSSADGNPGNSGGPLVTPQGKVVGIVVALRDNILYSIPVGELISAPADTTHFRRKYTYSHLILDNHLTRVFELDAPLPAPYRELCAVFYNSYKAYYPSAMEALFKEAPVFLDGPDNRYFLNYVVTSDFPQLAFVDKNDNQWKVSDLDVQNNGLPDDGMVMLSTVSGMSLVKLRRPKSADAVELNSNPRAIMDRYLSGVSTKRALGSAEYRILSFGEPAGVGDYRDKQGRRWIKAWWLVDFEDSVILAYILPMPNGPVIFMTRQSSSQRHVYEWDMEETCNKIMVAYLGDLDEWESYIGLKEWMPASLKEIKLDWNDAARTIDLALPQLTIKTDDRVFEWTGASTLFMMPAYYRKDGKIEYDFRSLFLQRDIKGKDYFLILEHVKPDERLGAKTMENWNDVVAAKYPYDGVGRISSRDNTGTAAGLLEQEGLSADVRYSLYLNMENPVSEEALTGRYKTLESGISVIK
ncbi:MAG: serine protease [Treponema sp.]|nr:serine protease [Treponema sp.]